MGGGGKAWAVPKFRYGERVEIVPLAGHNEPPVKGRVVDLHFLGMYGAAEYDVIYYADSKQFKIRVMEDELIGVSA